MHGGREAAFETGTSVSFLCKATCRAFDVLKTLPARVNGVVDLGQYDLWIVPATIGQAASEDDGGSRGKIGILRARRIELDDGWG
jgi:hypothetical protein